MNHKEGVTSFFLSSRFFLLKGFHTKFDTAVDICDKVDVLVLRRCQDKVLVV